MKISKVMGFVFILMSGFIYTLEKGFNLLATSTVKGGFMAGENTGEVPEIETIGYFDNLFVPVFMVLGIILLIYSFRKKKR